jgi:hypothetical protein
MGLIMLHTRVVAVCTVLQCDEDVTSIMFIVPNDHDRIKGLYRRCVCTAWPAPVLLHRAHARFYSDAPVLTAIKPAHTHLHRYKDPTDSPRQVRIRSFVCPQAPCVRMH